VLNPTVWPLSAEIQFAGAEPIRISPYGDARPATVKPSAGGAIWSVQLEPYDLVAGEVAGARTSILGWSIAPPDDAAQSLREQIRDVARRANQLYQTPRPVTLANSSFESFRPDFSPANWSHATSAGLDCRVDRRVGSQGQCSLHLQKSADAPPLWVRSDPFVPPTTGRIEVRASIRVADPARQPQLRLAIEGKLDGQVYYRRVNIGSPERPDDPSPPQLKSTWGVYSISIPDRDGPGLPTAGLTDLRVGFDLMSEGEVWIDDVQVFDLWLQEKERDELTKSVAALKLQADHGELYDAGLFVDGYWPSFLRRHVPLADVGPVAAPPIAARILPRPKLPLPRKPATPAAEPEEAPAKTADRKRSWVPSWIWK
jgi:hypothetical protein